MKNFALIGASGYVAPKHMRAIKDNGGNLLAAIDPSDSVGIIDSYFPEASFFTEIERFDRYIDKSRRAGPKVDYVSICSPNYLHDSHIRLALRNNCDAICEKPLVIMPKNLQYLEDLESETGRRINCILQLRHHPIILDIRDAYKDTKEVTDIDLTYITSRGKWYDYSWKGSFQKSGGLAANIGIHFFDMLMWIFGDVRENIVTKKSHDDIAGELRLDRAIVKWRLSTNGDNLPKRIIDSGERAYRNFNIGGRNLEFSNGFTDLHSSSYTEILKGKGFGVQDARPSLEVVSKIANWSNKS